MSPDRVVTAGAIDVERAWKRFAADRTPKGFRELPRHALKTIGRRRRWTWALRDVSLQIEPGAAVGLIGANGSGKSTLLKLITGTMDPYAGSVEVGGRIGALIEVTSGIHPELTGRENVFLYGSLLGLPRQVAAERFDAIVEFAGLENSVDRQVKFFSSGMKMRLGFAVAAFLEPDVLLVDEVLAVGDAAFQQRCLDRIRHVLSLGTTLILVSHDLAAVEATCDAGVWLDGGVVREAGPIQDVMASYREWVDEMAAAETVVEGDLRLLKSLVSPIDGPVVRSHGALDVELVIEAQHAQRARICIGVSEGTAAPTFLLRHDVDLRSGANELRCRIHHLPLPQGRYYVWSGAFDGQVDLLPWHPSCAFDVDGRVLEKPPAGIVRLAPVAVEASWELGE